MPQPEKGGAKAAGSSNKPAIVSGEALSVLEESIRKDIALRAYELYQSRGRNHGNDMQDWFAAENELIKPSNVQIENSGRQLSVRAGVPGFDASDIQIGVSSQRLIIWGQTTRAASEGGRMQMLSEIDLPVPVEPTQASATVIGGVLQWQAAKAKPDAT